MFLKIIISLINILLIQKMFEMITFYFPLQIYKIWNGILGHPNHIKNKSCNDN